MKRLCAVVVLEGAVDGLRGDVGFLVHVIGANFLIGIVKRFRRVLNVIKDAIQVKARSGDLTPMRHDFCC